MVWNEKYKPKSLKEYVDQKEAVQIFLNWMKQWKPGKKALLLYGPPGVGKTALVEAFASEHRYELISMNASDERSAERVRAVLGEACVSKALVGRAKLFLIDEVDGIAGQEDKGGIAEVVKLIRSSVHPVVLIANNPYEKKLRALREHCQLLQLRRLPKRDVERRLAQICEQEKIRVGKEVLSAIAARSEGDLRAAINDLEVVARGKQSIGVHELDVLGYREREASIFDALKIIFKSKSANAARLATLNLDVDPDEVFWWIEHNVIKEYEKPEEVVEAYEALAKADLFRRYVTLRQNWRFKSYMTDLMCAGVSLAKEDVYRKFTKYEYPARLIVLGGSKAERREEREQVLEWSIKLHCSTRKVRSEFLPFFKLFKTRAA